MSVEPRPQPAELVQETQFTATQVSSADAHDAQRENEQAAAGASTYGSVNRQPVSSQQGYKKPARVLGPDLLRSLICVFQALDHASVMSGAWRHGVAIESEADGQVVSSWNIPIAWVARMLTHLCAPGFMFLLGMGVVYFGRSRKKLGWSQWRLFKHFFIRGLVLALVNEVLGFLLLGGKMILLNMVLLALAVDYFLAGTLWLVLSETEDLLSDGLAAIPALQDADAAVAAEERPLLSTVGHPQSGKHSVLASNISFHIHNAVMLALASVTIWWNVWLSPDGGHCHVKESHQQMDILAIEQSPSGGGFFEFMFHPVNTPKIMSGFPPLAWVSFAILGMLYARTILLRQRSTAAIVSLTALLGAAFAGLFVLTRLLHFGNLSEGCLQMPENRANPGRNQYLVSFRAFFYSTKYPPSPAYMFYTMAMNMFFLAGFSALPALPAKIDGDENSEAWSAKALRVIYGALLPFGQCALFFYAVHTLIYVGLGSILKRIWGHGLGFDDPFSGGESIGIGHGAVFWLYWLSGLVVLWFLCRWYAQFKGKKGPDSLWRFF